MKSKLLQAACALALLVLAGRYFAAPALADVLKAALIQDRDAPARNYFQTVHLSCGYAIGYCAADLPPVPAGNRLVITNVSGDVFTYGANDLFRIALWRKDFAAVAYLPFSPANMTSNYEWSRAFSQQIFAVFDAGQTPQLVVDANNNSHPLTWEAVASGYYVQIP